MRAVLFPTCLVETLFPQAGRAALELLKRAGCEVEVRKDAVCCGQPAWNSGYIEEARRVGTGAVRALAAGSDPVVLCSGSCTSMVREYWPELFSGTPEEDAARRVSARARELSQFLARDLGPQRLGRLELPGTRVAHHDSCHMLRILGETEAPRRLLGAIAGLELQELSEPGLCCGFGGTFSLRFPELSGAMADEKIADAEASGATVLTACDLGCLMHISGRAGATGRDLRCAYIAELLREAAV